MKKVFLIFILGVAILFPPASSYRYEEVQVQPNDTIWRLVASRNNDEKSMDELIYETVKINGFENGSVVLQPGDRIKIAVAE